jgi:hypothetical protein
VEEYCRKFKQLVYNIRLYDISLSNTMLTTKFLLGLKAKLRARVEMQLPEIVAKASILAAMQEQLLEKFKRGGGGLRVMCMGKPLFSMINLTTRFLLNLTCGRQGN